jgi:hypothetical protein
MCSIFQFSISWRLAVSQHGGDEAQNGAAVAHKTKTSSAFILPSSIDPL